ncbi:efflux RND transporter periplasmic adaptor subunit [Propionivibrio limicola]|uniref:efflux RND transporter periplasmic adaptor subunit n=1 Tax=Propionivibrio limicola TaxID=167645 RepID=UPI001292A7AC|nr:efflux RND transporter periplasmic adaptor subunit [Propionivibrio limicola]
MTPVRAALLAACVVAATACSKGGDTKKAAPPVPVIVAQAETRDVPVSLRMVGRAEAFESVTLKARLDGQVASVHFTEGQHVKQGDVLIRLDPADYAARLRQAEANTARDTALQEKLRADTVRYTALRERNFISDEKLNDVRTNETAATANLRASQAAAELARVQHSYTTIRAPISGVIGARLVFPGSSVKANDTAVAVINRVRPLLVGFALPEKHLPTVRAAMQAGELGVQITVPASPGANAAPAVAGKVRFIDNAVDAATGTILLKAEIRNDPETLTPGQFLNVSLVLDTLKDAVTVPSQAVQQGPEGHFVFVVSADQSVEVRRVDIAGEDSGRSAVSRGLKSGETVVTDGQLRLTPGAKVKPQKAEEKRKDTNAGSAPTDAS